MDEMVEELAEYYAALGYPLYTKEALETWGEEDLRDLYEMTFPNHS